MRGNKNNTSEKWGALRVNAYMLSPNFVPNKGRRWVKSVSVTAIPNKARKGIKNKNKHKSALLPTVFKPFIEIKALSKKNIAKEKVVGAVSKNAA